MSFDEIVEEVPKLTGEERVRYVHTSTNMKRWRMKPST